MPDKAKQLPQYIASIIAAIGAFSLGTAIGWANPVQNELQSGKYNFPVSESDFSWISSTFVLGAMCTCMPSGFFINLFGRKWTIIGMCLPFIIGWVLVIVAPNLIVMYVGRFLIGFSGGSYCVSVPVYTAEIAEKQIRGLLGTLFQFMVVVGILFVYAMGAVVNALILSAACAIFPVILALLMFFMPESPTHLVKKDKLEAANKSLEWFRGKDFDFKPEVDDIRSADANEKANPVSAAAAFKRSETIRAFIISSMLMVFQQVSGINIVIFYSTDIFEAANTGFSAAFSTVLLGIVQVFATFASMMLVDRLGRRVLLLISAGGMATCTICLGIYFCMKDGDPKSTESLGWLPVTSMCLFIIFFSIGYGPIPWLMMGEIFSTDIKGLAGSISATLNWCCAFFVTKTFVNLRNLMGTGGTFFFFAILTVLGIFFVLFVVIETKGKSLNEIQAELTSLNKPKA